MSSLSHPPVLRRGLQALVALAVAAVAMAALAAGASAAPATGEVVLTLKQGAKSSLLREGVKASPRSGKGKTQTVKLKVADLDKSSRTVKSGTTLTLRAKGKSVKLRGVELKAGAKSTALSAQQGGKRQVFFRIQGNLQESATTLSAKGPLALTGAGATALRKALGLEGISSGRIGSGNFSASVPPAPAPAPAPPAPPAKGPEEPQPVPYPYSAQCPIAPVSGNPGFGKAPGQVASILPEPTFSPDAYPVTGTALDWGFKQGFRNYVLNVKTGSLVPMEGVTESNPGAMGALGAYFGFPAAAGDYEEGVPGDYSDDKLVVEGTGTVVFCKTVHGFSVVLKDPTLTIDGANSRITADVGANMNGVWYPLQRADIATLDLTGIEPEEVGGELVWNDIPAELTEDGATATGLYPAGTELDPITAKVKAPEPYPYASQCPVAPVTGGGGFGDAPGKVDGIAAEPVFAPGTSQEVTGTATDWGFKSAFRNYVLNIDAGPNDSLQALSPATASAVGPGMASPTAYFGFPTDEGTYERGSEADHSDDKLVVESAGTVIFCKPKHGFSIVLRNPTVTIDGEDSRITADVGINLNGEWYPFQRADIADLDLSTVEPTITDSGNTLVWANVPAKMSADGATAFGDLYAAGTVLDTITVKTSLNRPLLAQCGIVAGNPAPEPVVDFGLEPLPVLNSPVTGSGGTINWGFRRAFRSTVKTNGTFALLGGATESYPGNMGGAAGAPPVGGDGKFFRFPIDRYSYDAGAAGGGDDRLIATSEASVGFCNSTHGYAALISKVTLVIDGADSRIIANVYSFQKDKGWVGGRVDVVDLNSTGIDAVAGSGTVSWGEVLGNETPLSVGIPAVGGFLTEALKLAAMAKGGATGTFDPVAAQINLPA